MSERWSRGATFPTAPMSRARGCNLDNDSILANQVTISDASLLPNHLPDGFWQHDF